MATKYHASGMLVAEPGVSPARLLAGPGGRGRSVGVLMWATPRGLTSKGGFIAPVTDKMKGNGGLAGVAY